MLKMKKLLIILATVVFMFSSVDMKGWGRSGHDAVASIADRHLTKKARKEIEKILGGKSIIYYTKWADEIRKTPEFLYTDKWHVNYIDKDGNVVVAEKHGKNSGDLIYGLRKQVMPVMENREAYDDSTVCVNLKFLIHFIGDMHCPTHLKFEGVKEGNVYIDGQKLTHHRLWDFGILDSVHGWSYTEYADQLDRASKKEIEKICEGTFEEWVEDNGRRCREIHSWVEPDYEVTQDYKNKAVLLAEHQLMIAGYRLAHVLNELFK